MTSTRHQLAGSATAIASRDIMPVSVIVCSRNRREMLRDSIDSILAGKCLPRELLVIDQSDTPDESVLSRPAVPGSELRYVWSAQIGLSRGNNRGVEIATSDILVFTHDDVRVDPDWLGVLTQALIEAGPMSIVSGRILADGPGYAPTLSPSETPGVFEGLSALGRLRPLNVAMYRDAFERVGGFDPRLGPGTRFPGAEDADLGYRLIRAGYRIVYEPKALVFHRAWRAERDYLPLRWGYGVAHGAFYAKHLRRDRALLTHIRGDVVHRIRRFPRRLFREPLRAWGDPLFLIGNVVGAVRWLLSSTSRTDDGGGEKERS